MIVSQNKLSRHLKGKWFNGDIAANTVRDESGNGNFLRSTFGGTGPISDGLPGRARWDANHSILTPSNEVSDFALSVLGQSFIVSYWGYLETPTFTSSSGTLFGHTNGPNIDVSGFIFSLLNGNFRFARRVRSGSTQSTISNSPIPLQQDFHCVFTRDGVSEEINLYINETVDANFDGLTTDTDIEPNTTNRFVIGASVDNISSGGMAGIPSYMDVWDFQIYLPPLNTALPSNMSEIIQYLRHHPRQGLPDKIWGA